MWNTTQIDPRFTIGNQENILDQVGVNDQLETVQMASIKKKKIQKNDYRRVSIVPNDPFKKTLFHGFHSEL